MEVSMTRRRTTVDQAQQSLSLFPTEHSRFHWSDLPRDARQATVALVARMLLRVTTNDNHPVDVAQGGQEHE